ncbi:MAG: NAD-dependent epimerase/dehydratase family protein [Planctomycetaceae bacterium]|jgi:farnesol dehydrogenase|nr:NAD-dependent epimerase/dehydratase family protein [Planctomycetaceae bacterium]
MNANKKVFVTGSTGFIGSVLVEKLLQQGYSVRALTRSKRIPDNKTKNENLEYCLGDINNPKSLQDAMLGCDCVFHLAAYAKNWAKNPKTFAEVNLVGTRNVFASARKNNIQRIVWTSTIVTLGPTLKGVIGDESMPRQRAKYFTEYEKTKTVMENESLQWIADGLPLVIVNPTRVFGPGVMSESNSVTRLIDNYRRGRFPFLLNWGRNVGNYGYIDDVAEGHILAMERGTIGERYILGGENVSLKDVFDTITRIDGKRHLQFKMYCLIPLLVAKIFELRAKWLGIYPPITPDWVRTFITDWAFSCEKAKNELGYKPIPFEEAVRRTCEWLDKRNNTGNNVEKTQNNVQHSKPHH